MGVEHSKVRDHNDGAINVSMKRPKPHRMKDRVRLSKSKGVKFRGNTDVTSLDQLITDQKWQKALNRIATHPKEVTMDHRVEIFGMECKVLPLHLACALKAPVEVVNALLRADKDARSASVPVTSMSTKKRSGIDPLQPLQSNKQSISPSPTPTNQRRKQLEIVRYPKCLSWEESVIPSHADEYSGQTDSHGNPIALQLTRDGGVVKSHISSPSSTGLSSTENLDRYFNFNQPSHPSEYIENFLPIHIACFFRAQCQVIQILIAANPAGVKLKNMWGMLPIHIVCSNLFAQLSPVAATGDVMSHQLAILSKITTSGTENYKWNMTDVVSLLVSEYHQSVNIPSSNALWMTPVGYASDNINNAKVREEVIYIMRRRDDARETSPTASTGAMEPCLPIHVACKSRAPKELVMALIEDFPEGVHTLDRNGALPLHLACQHHAPLDSIRALLRAYPNGASARDHSGLLPIHLACTGNASLSVVEALLRAYPEGREMKDYNGHTPLTYLESSSCKQSLGLVTLLNHEPRQRGRKSSVPVTTNEDFTSYKGMMEEEWIVEALKGDLGGTDSVQY
mmetsp:Transcript_28192/g.40850  ORF Transcript_28192/g.40850 Transcript_28192/m.40850 type:complete len:568 (-) Transcript_28192:163-1866(-)